METVMSKIKKYLRTLLLIFLLIFALFPLPMQTVTAATTKGNQSYDQVEKNGEIVLQYITVTNNMIYFDYSSAVRNGESDSIIAQGLTLEHISARYASGGSADAGTSSNQRSAISLPIWGNYCGPGYGGKDSSKPALDVLDEGCKRHDQCYKWSFSIGNNCTCNKNLIDYIDSHKGQMSGTMAVTAWAIRTYFATIGQIGC
ncbi:MAG: hypothetical protein J6I76_08880 [Oribacterium sp.]|nr:hypothetical protein [Oribacterium sp.]